VRPYNGLAIASFVTSLLLVLFPVALVLGIVALVKLRSGQQQGRGLAIAGVAVSGATLVLVVLAAVFGGDLDEDGTGAERGARTDVFDIKVGDCFDTGNIDKYEDGHLEESVRRMSCDAPHQAEAIGAFEVEGFEDFPGRDVLSELAFAECGRFVQPYLLDTWRLSDDLAMYFYHPEEVSWLLEDREVLCFIAAPDSTSLTGSLRGAPEDFSPAQRTLLDITAEVDGLVWTEPAEDAELSTWHAWAGSMADATEQQVAALRSADWADAETAALAEALAEARESSAPVWREAATASPDTAFWRLYEDGYDAYGFFEEEDLRRRLGLATG
jgi:hypothetical protein